MESITLLETVENEDNERVVEHNIPLVLVERYVTKNGYESVEDFLNEYTSENTIELVSQRDFNFYIDR